MTAVAFKCAYADWKLIKTRGVVQLVFEVPLAEADAAYEILGGMPDAARERWFGIAPLKLPQAEKENAKPVVTSKTMPATPSLSPPAEKAKRDWRDLPAVEQAGIRCADPIFRNFLRDECGFDVQSLATAEIVVRQLCKVESRKEYNTDPLARSRWQGLDDQFLAWRYADA